MAVDQSIPGIVVHSVAVTGDGSTVVQVAPGADSITIQVVGTVDSASVALEVSNDRTNYVAAPTAVSLSAVGVESAAADSLGFLSYRVTVSGSGTEDFTVIVVSMQRSQVTQ